MWVRLEDGTERHDIRQIDNFTPHSISADAGSARPASSCLPISHSAITDCTFAPMTPSPTRCSLSLRPFGLPDRMGARRSWGLATQLYSVRSKDSWGIGDLVDLADLAVWAGAKHGAGYVLINPLHAASPAKPMEPSLLAHFAAVRQPALPAGGGDLEFAFLPKRSRVRALRGEAPARSHYHRDDRPRRRLGS